MHKLPLLLTILLLGQGCVNLKPQEKTTRFYVLGAHIISDKNEAETASSGLSVGLRRLDLATYLDTPRIVVRLGDNEVSFSENHRWGEDLRVGINRTVARLLANDPTIRRTDAVPWPLSARHDYVVQIQVRHFEGVVERPGDVRAHLEAAWKILDPMTHQVLRQGTTDEWLEAGAADRHAGIVSALDKALSRLSDELAEALISQL